MTRGLHIFNATVLALMATFAVTLGVVCLIYSFYLDAGPRIRDEWQHVSWLTAAFTLLTLISAAAFWGQLRHKTWRWPAEATMVLALAAGTTYLIRTLS